MCIRALITDQETIDPIITMANQINHVNDLRVCTQVDQMRQNQCQDHRLHRSNVLYVHLPPHLLPFSFSFLHRLWKEAWRPTKRDCEHVEVAHLRPECGDLTNLPEVIGMRRDATLPPRQSPSIGS